MTSSKSLQNAWAYLKSDSFFAREFSIRFARYGIVSFLGNRAFIRSIRAYETENWLSFA